MGARPQAFARKIIFYVKNGFRFKDIVVIAENLEEYEMFIERIFLLYKIPFFIDKKIFGFNI